MIIALLYTVSVLWWAANWLL